MHLDSSHSESAQEHVNAYTLTSRPRRTTTVNWQENCVIAGMCKPSFSYTNAAMQIKQAFEIAHSIFGLLINAGVGLDGPSQCSSNELLFQTQTVRGRNHSQTNHRIIYL